MFNRSVVCRNVDLLRRNWVDEIQLTKLVKFGTFKKVRKIHHVEVSMSRQKNAQIPLGELLMKARLERGFSRAHVAKEAGVSENSLVRYEKAGLEDDGQYPPSPKLASLCFCLEINPLLALLSCLGGKEYWQYYSQTGEDWLMEHPAHNYVSDQFHALLRDNHIMREALRVLLDPEQAKEEFGPYIVDWVKEEVRKVISVQDAFEQKMKDIGIYRPVERGMAIPGATRLGQDDPYDYAAKSHDYTGKKNGPDG